MRRILMDKPASLSHSTWERKNPAVLIPKCRRRTLYAQLRRHLGEVFHHLARQKFVGKKRKIAGWINSTLTRMNPLQG
jgi:hypothetical protein